MKVEYKIPTPFGTIIRTSLREYTHIVVAGKRTEESVRENHAATVRQMAKTLEKYRANVANDYAENRAFEIKLIGRYGAPPFDANNPEHVARVETRIAEWIAYYAKWIADAEVFLRDEKSILEDFLQNRKPHGLVGFAGNRRLAEKLASGWDARNHEDVTIIEIKPEHRREIVARKRK
jgi:hypothetical protein